jgi:hypothetical protein
MLFNKQEWLFGGNLIRAHPEMLDGHQIKNPL